MSYQGGRPAGMSSDEESSDDGYEFASPKTKREFLTYISNEVKNLNPEEELFVAVKSNNVTKVKELIFKGVNLNYVKDDWTPLMFACFHGYPEVVKLLLSNGSDAGFHRHFFTPLMAVCSNSEYGSENSRKECVEILLGYGVDINAADRFRMSALMFAAREGLDKIVELLIEKVCDINKQDSDGWSALFHAVFNNKPKVIEVLIAHGANTKLKDTRGRTLNHLALSKGFEELAEKVKTEQDDTLPEPMFLNITPVVTIDQMLNELPNKRNGEKSGFSTDIFNLLQGMNMQAYIECFYKSGLDLGEFLVINSERLQEIGVRFSSHREKILYSLKRFHLYRWQKSSIGLKSKNEAIELIDGVKLLGNTVRQLYVLQSSLHYLQLNKPEGNITKELKRIISTSLELTEQIESELLILQTFGRHIEKVKKVRPVDLIRKEENQEKKVENVFKISIACLFGVIIMWKYKDSCLSVLKLNT